MAAIELLGDDTAAGSAPRGRHLVLIAALGILGLLRDAWPSLSWPPINLHAAFGASLLVMIVMCFRGAAWGAALTGADVQALCRRSSRAVYLLLYVVFGAQQILRLAGAGAGALAPENLRDYLAYGLCALLVIRALALLSRRPPALRMSLRWARAVGGVARR